VLSAGGVKSPHLLMLSGIGPRAELESVGIRVVHDSPGVGKNFSDHPEVSVGWRPRRDIVDLRSPQVLTHMLNFTAAGSDGVSDLEILQMVKPTGYLLTGRSQVVASGLATLLRHPLRSLQSVRGVSRRRLAQQLTHHADLSFIVAVQAETSRGNITLESADPSTPPRIDYNYLSTESDRSRMREAVRVTVSILRSQAFAPLFGRLTELDDRTLDDDALLDAWMLTHLGTAIHLCGSARFGGAGDRGAVVDQYGRVHGIEGLRVADTSILPSTPTRGPAATAVLIGELVADFIRRGAY
jgi:choline dehydrogenase-like flavoprotein